VTIKAIETRYNGYRFRSRLEARWAVFLDSLRVRYVYEPQGVVLDGEPYLPDFWLPIVHPTHPGAGYWLEIKPAALDPREHRLLARLAVLSGHNAVCLQGSCGLGEFVTRKFCRVTARHPGGWWFDESTGGPSRDCPGVRDNQVYPYGLSYVTHDMPDDLPAEALEVAFAAARSARFEHGETPRPR
jgi:hypothetical protein